MLKLSELKGLNDLLRPIKSEDVKSKSSRNDQEGKEEKKSFQFQFKGAYSYIPPIRVEKCDPKSRIKQDIFNKNNSDSFMSIQTIESKNKHNVAKNAAHNQLKVTAFMSDNERRKMVQNNLEDNLLGILRRNLEDQSSKAQLQLKREKSMLFDQYVETKVINYNYAQRRKMLDLRAKKNNEDRIEKIDNFLVKRQSIVSSSKKTESKADHEPETHEEKVVMMVEDTGELKEASTESFNLFSKEEEDLISKAMKLNSNLFDRFVEQKRHFMPQYLKQVGKSNKIAMTEEELLRISERAKKRTQKYRNVCSKYKDHRIAEQKAEEYVHQKNVNKDLAEYNELLRKNGNKFYSQSMPNLSAGSNENKTNKPLELPELTFSNTNPKKTVARNPHNHSNHKFESKSSLILPSI